MARAPRTLMLLLALLLGAGLVGSCGDESSDQDAVAAVKRAATKSADLGIRFSTQGTVTSAGQDVAFSARSSVEPGGKRAVMKASAGGTDFEQYVDGRFILMSVDILPSTRGLPPGTRWLRFDVDKLGASIGVETGPLRELQSLDPARAAALAAEFGEIRTLGPGTVDGVKVTRYATSGTLGEAAEALNKSSGISIKLPKELRDGTFASELSIDASDRLRAFRIKVDVGPIKMDLTNTVTSYSEDIRIEAPSGGEVFDVTDELVSGLGELG